MSAPADASRSNRAAEWEAWFSYLRQASPVREQLFPMADYECRTCGRIGCTQTHEPTQGGER